MHSASKDTLEFQQQGQTAISVSPICIALSPPPKWVTSIYLEGTNYKGWPLGNSAEGRPPPNPYLHVSEQVCCSWFIYSQATLKKKSILPECPSYGLYWLRDAGNWQDFVSPPSTVNNCHHENTTKVEAEVLLHLEDLYCCLLYTSPSPRD